MSEASWIALLFFGVGTAWVRMIVNVINEHRESVDRVARMLYKICRMFEELDQEMGEQDREIRDGL